MSDKYVQYEHHGKQVWVEKVLKGTHRDYCLCYSCANWKPTENSKCPLAQELYELCVRNSMTTPVFECPEFVEMEVGGAAFGAPVVIKLHNVKPPFWKRVLDGLRSFLSDMYGDHLDWKDFE